ncbi:MAG TPA: M17 family peptidase N-terminal domain-containing protein, partial [Acidimicrobiia bacterium]|nr:M17 family peptidase N-terminal domain-containing protein [Acidimicrobiia bacterium]
MADFTGLTTFDPVPSLQHIESVTVTVTTRPPEGSIVGHLVAEEGDLPPELELDRDTLRAAGFEGKTGQTILIPRVGSTTLVLVGIGSLSGLDADGLRDAAAAFARATETRGDLALA